MGRKTPRCMANIGDDLDVYACLIYALWPSFCFKYEITSVILTSSPLLSPAASLPTCGLILTVPAANSFGARMATKGI